MENYRQEDEKNIKLSFLIAEVKSSNDVLHEQLKHIQELFSEKLDRIYTESKTTNEKVSSQAEKIEKIQEKLVEIQGLKTQIEFLNEKLKTIETANVEEVKKLKDLIDDLFEQLELLKRETEVVRVDQKHPEISKYNEIGKLVSNIIIILSAIAIIYSLFFDK